MICEKCGKVFFEDWRRDKETRKTPCRFCSRNCANGRKHTKEQKEKISLSMKEYVKNNEFGSFSSLEHKKNFLEASKKASQEFSERVKKELLEADFNSLSFERMKKRVILEQEKKCNRCGLNDWLGQEITFELHHKDGNNKNNIRENVECLCPNCHALTETWRGKNNNINRNKIETETLIETFLKTGNIRQTLIEVGLTPKGGNYDRIKKALTLRGIPYNKKEIAVYKK